jgi:hypothetical protein
MYPPWTSSSSWGLGNPAETPSKLQASRCCLQKNENFTENSTSTIVVMLGIFGSLVVKDGPTTLYIYIYIYL